MGESGGLGANWAGNLHYSAARIHRPTSVVQIQELVAKSDWVKPLGTRHSFSDVADTAGDLISTTGLDRVLEIDRAARTVAIEPGVTYGKLGPILDEAGLGLPNLASLPHISVVGACATATHGSGVANQCLSASVRELTMVVASGEVVTLRRGEQDFAGAVVSLGALGVVTKATLDLVPRFEIQQYVYERLPLAELADHFDDILGASYSLSLFHDWQSERVNQVWLKRLASDLPEPESFYGARPAPAPRHPLPGLSAENCTTQLGIAGPWYDRLPHFRLEFTPSNGEELQTEYFVPFGRGWEAMEAVRGLRGHLAPVLQVSEIRTVAADDLWLSPCYRRTSLSIHFTWRQDWPGVRSVLPLIEDALAPFEPRPHWGKLFAMATGGSYPAAPQFRKLVESLDPTGKFHNAFLLRNVLG